MLIKNITLIDENYDVIEDSNIVIEENVISYIGKDIPQNYAGYIYDGKNKVAVPGLFNMHCPCTNDFSQRIWRRFTT
ncbi:hypothetical protein [Clostridium botulinum]|uniref:hypothetical protein n=1 Tax=Clostridium botulinum TaxID=1491 RepID=UPI0002F5B2E5|nr:hypothetical protein [Clostridium botulinum]